jgi:hypothetical protein
MGRIELDEPSLDDPVVPPLDAGVTVISAVHVPLLSASRLSLTPRSSAPSPVARNVVFSPTRNGASVPIFPSSDQHLRPGAGNGRVFPSRLIRSAHALGRRPLGYIR